MRRWILPLVGLFGLAGTAAAQERYFEIRVVDERGAGVPCVALTTVHALRYVTDASGRVAFYEPGLMDTDVWFHVAASHVEVEPDLFAYRGARLAVTPGGAAEIAVRRTGDPSCDADDLDSRRLARGVPAPEGWFRVDVTDAETGRGVPLVELELGDRVLVSDSAGVIAIDPLGFEGEPIEATLRSHGYAFADDGRVALDVEAGGHARVTATRAMIAERLYRVTGGGIYRDSVVLGLEVPLAQPVIDGLVLGQDTAFTAVHRGRLFWIWGDTNRPAYPLGHFRTSGATSALPADGGLDPEQGVDLTYFVGEDGFSRPMIPRETVPGDGVFWSSGLVSVPDAGGTERLFAVFGEYASLTERTRRGMLEYDDEAARFEEAVDFDDGPDERYPRENAFLVEHGDERFVYYHQSVRVPARAEALRDPSTYEAFTPFTDREGTIERDADGRATYRWRAVGIPQPPADSDLGADALGGHLVDAGSGRGFTAHENGSTEQNDHTGRYLRLVMNRADLGEIWVALADTPMGPWVTAERVVHHDRYTFYNPRQHRAFDRDFGRRVYFEGTYTSSFSGAPARTPRYDYNQVMYAIDLDRPELALPVPIYESARGELGPQEVIAPGDAPIAALFLAPVGPRPGTEPVWWSGPACEPRRLIVGGSPATPPLFYARPSADAAGHQRVLYEVWDEGAPSPRYGLDDDGDAHPLAVVWENPIRVALPVADHRRGPFPDAGPDRCLADGEPLALAEGTWRVDGEASDGGAITLAPGLHVVTRIEARPDGFAVEDHAIVRVGPAPTLTPPAASGCGCRVRREAPGPPAWLVVVVVLGVRRRRPLLGESAPPRGLRRERPRGAARVRRSRVGSITRDAG